MTLPPDLVDELQGVLSSFGAARRTASFSFVPGKALELWLMMRIANHVRTVPGWDVGLYNGFGHRLAHGVDFIVRSQPGAISAPRREAPGYVRISRPANYGAGAFELHGSLQFEGRSGARHECDISFITSRVGSRIREDGGGRPTGVPVAAIECKHHASDGSIGEAREKVARLFDLAHLAQAGSSVGFKLFWTGRAACGWGSRASSYRATFSRGLFGIARSSGFQRGAGELADFYGIKRYPEVYSGGSSLALCLQVVDCLRRA